MLIGLTAVLSGAWESKLAGLCAAESPAMVENTPNLTAGTV